MSKYVLKYEIDKRELSNFTWGSIGSKFNTRDLGRWLETKTEEQFTVIHTQAIEDLLKFFNTQQSQITLFKKNLFENLDYLKLKIDLEDSLDENDE